MCVCVFVCPRSYLRNYTSDLRQFFMLVTYGRGSVFGRRCDTLCTSGFMDDVIFAHKPRLLDVAAQLNRNAHEWVWLYAVRGSAASGLLLGLCHQPPVRGLRSYSPRDRTM